MTSRPSIFWFRRDLRLRDHPALEAAAAAGAGEVYPVFIIDDGLLAATGPNRAAFLRATLEDLRASLGGHLTLRVGEAATVLADLADEVGATHVYATSDYAPRGHARDLAVNSRLAEHGVTFVTLDSPYVVAPGTVTTKSGTPCRVFGAFRRGWELEPWPAPGAAVRANWRSLAGVDVAEVTERSARRRPDYFGPLGLRPARVLPPAGEVAAYATLARFRGVADEYAATRNQPGLDATSRLSPYLRFGSIHPRQVLAAVAGAGEGRSTFVSELAWREFYADVLWHHPSSARENLQPSFDALEVDRGDVARERFARWANGETGFPIVDAGMRQLLDEGWMHNRVRMIVASFLVKHLHLDWRWGAHWFLWHLIDGDVASNQHGWQWTAGSGTDAAPFHRVFNPTLQAERFDPEGTYVRRYVEELRDVPAPQCLRPGAGDGLLRPAGYPEAMIDAGRERDEALARFAALRAQRSAT